MRSYAYYECHLSSQPAAFCCSPPPETQELQTGIDQGVGISGIKAIKPFLPQLIVTDGELPWTQVAEVVEPMLWAF